MAPSSWNKWLGRKAKGFERERLRSVKRRWFPRLSLERLEDRLAPTVTSLVDAAGNLRVTVSPGAPEDVTIASVQFDVLVNGNNPDSGAIASAGIKTITVTGDANANTIDF